MRLGIIGGSLLKSLNAFKAESEEVIKTPYGDPSDVFVSGTINNHPVVLLNRHGDNHQIAPHQVNYKANIFVMKMLEVSHILSVNAVGGITAGMAPGRWVVPDQLIDYTHGRNQTYNDFDEEPVTHIDFTWPFDHELRHKLLQVLDVSGINHEVAGTYGVTQGPRLETAAEIQKLKRDGCDIVGMTVMPEAGLARELDIAYAGLCNVVNWAAGLSNQSEGHASGSPASECPGHENPESGSPEPGTPEPGGTVSMDEINVHIAQADEDMEIILPVFTDILYD